MPGEVDRRGFLAAGVLLASVGGTPPASAAAPVETESEHMRAMMAPPAADAPKVGMLIYPKMVALDLIGPMTAFKIARFDIALVAKDSAPVSTDLGLPLAPTHRFDEAAKDLDVLFVPGGIMGTIDCMRDPEVLAFLADRGSRARWVTSVCTGGLVLAAAGLLKGFDATTHWAVADLLPLMGARHVDKRVVKDRNRMTGGGVTAGIDFALTLIGEMKGEEPARRVQLRSNTRPLRPSRTALPPRRAPSARRPFATVGDTWMNKAGRPRWRPEGDWASRSNRPSPMAEGPESPPSRLRGLAPRPR